ncbi:acyl carrier protein [[Pseudopropionibacterium] massiliense]|uniref:acyl carrier protein n=1 Tax=[Pseudopropionibacterium] massiliense TaxID=2220000 RepID=UPI0010313ED3|nr:acyl carrier protein [[Pseudopropionibacterium] massiliense]
MNKETIKTVLINEIASELKVASTDVDEYASFTRMGVSSVQALKIINHLRKELSVNINPVALFEFNTVDDISTYLAEEFA